MTMLVEAQQNDNASSRSPAGIADPLAIRRQPSCRAARSHSEPHYRDLLRGQGARLIGSYDSVIAFASRALLVWRRIVLPDGSSIQIDNLPATDAAGYAGLEDEADFHTWRG